MGVVVDLLSGCQGPRAGLIGELRPANRLREVEAVACDPANLKDRLQVAAFPFFYRESGAKYRSTEFLWPLLQWGSGERSDYFRLWPLLKKESFPGEERCVFFPFYWRGREVRESGEVAYRHLWPLLGVEERPIDLAPAVTYHAAWPLFFFRRGEGQWRIHLFPAMDLSRGCLDRGWWLLPALKIGGDRRGNGWFLLLDPLLSWQRWSIAREGEALTDDNSRWAFTVLGGLLGWERGGGLYSARFLWLRI